MLDVLLIIAGFYCLGHWISKEVRIDVPNNNKLLIAGIALILMAIIF